VPSRVRGGFAYLAPGDRPDAIRVEPADRLLRPIRQSRDPAAGRVPSEPGNEILPDDRGAVKPDEQVWIQSFLKRSHRMMDQPAAPADVEAHVVALGRDAVDVAGGDAHEA